MHEVPFFFIWYLLVTGFERWSLHVTTKKKKITTKSVLILHEKRDLEKKFVLVQDTLILSAPSSSNHHECSKVFLSHFPSHHLDPVWPLCWGHHPSPILPPLSSINLSSKISIDHVRVELHHSFPTLLQHPFHVPSWQILQCLNYFADFLHVNIK